MKFNETELTHSNIVIICLLEISFKVWHFKDIIFCVLKKMNFIFKRL